MQDQIYIICGPTASGKSEYALHLANKLNGEIINADSIQVYKDIQAISAAPTIEEQAGIEHHLYGYLNYDKNNSVYEWLLEVKKTITAITNKNKTPIIVGGTGLYINALINGISEMPEIDTDIRLSITQQFQDLGRYKFYENLIKDDPNSAKLNVNDTQRLLRAKEVYEATKKPLSYWHQQPKFKIFNNVEFNNILLLPERSFLYEICNSRFIKLLEKGGMEEINKLYNKNISENYGPMKAIGVHEMVLFLQNKISYEEAIEKAQQATRNYAKRQITWFKNQLKAKKLVTFNNIKEYNNILKKL